MTIDLEWLAPLMPFIIPTISGTLIPFLMNAVLRARPMRRWVQSLLYFALSALTAAIPTVTYDGNVRQYFIAVGIAWLVSARTHYTGIPNALIPPYNPKHSLGVPRIDGNPRMR